MRSKQTTQNTNSCRRCHVLWHLARSTYSITHTHEPTRRKCRTFYSVHESVNQVVPSICRVRSCNVRFEVRQKRQPTPPNLVIRTQKTCAIESDSNSAKLQQMSSPLEMKEVLTDDQLTLTWNQGTRFSGLVVSSSDCVARGPGIKPMLQTVSGFLMKITAICNK